MSKRVILVLAFCVVAVIAFGAGAYYILMSGRYIITPVSAVETIVGVVTAHEYSSVTVRLDDGASKKISVNRNTQVLLSSPLTAKKLSDIEVGARIMIVHVNGLAERIEILFNPPVSATTTTQT